MNEIAHGFLQTYAAGGEPDGGWLFGKALMQARLDYTAESLLRLDALLAQMRDRVKPTRAQLDSPQGRNFESLLAFYVIEVVRRLSHFELAWYDRASALRALPPGTSLAEGPGTRLVVLAPVQQMMIQPLGWVEYQLLGEGPFQKAGDYVSGQVAQLQLVGRGEWWEVAYAAGRLASWQMQAAANGRPVLASTVSQQSPATLTVLGGYSARAEDQQKAVAYGINLLETNPEGVAWQVLAFNGFHQEAGVQQDAVIVLAATHGEMGARLALAFPYRQAYDGSGFAIARPKLREANLSLETMAKLNVSLERGIREAVWASGGSWDQFYRG
jgi:hypothetical protein